jgi:hypothetical protein
MKNTNKFLKAAVITAITLFSANNMLAAFHFGAQQQTQKNMNWNSMEFKDYFQVVKESTENIKILSDKVAVLEDTIKVMQATIDTLKDTVSQHHSTSIKMLNEALKK